MPPAMIVVSVLRNGFPRTTYKSVHSVFEKVRTELDLLVSDGIVKSWVSIESVRPVVQRPNKMWKRNSVRPFDR